MALAELLSGTLVPWPRLIYPPSSSLTNGPPTQLARWSNFVLRLHGLKPQRDAFSLHLLKERFCVQRIVLGRLFSYHPFLPPGAYLPEHITHGNRVEGRGLSVRRPSPHPVTKHLLAFRPIFKIFLSVSVLIGSWRMSMSHMGNICRRVWKVFHRARGVDQHKSRAVLKLKMSLMFIWSFLFPLL